MRGSWLYQARFFSFYLPSLVAEVWFIFSNIPEQQKSLILYIEFNFFSPSLQRGIIVHVGEMVTFYSYSFKAVA